jgi:hypothetical protein
MTDHVLLEPPVRRWECPNCTQRAVTREVIPQARYHQCAGLRGMTAPMVLEGSDVKVEAVEREDYVGSETVTTDGEGRPIMAVITTRADGSNDCAVMAPCATNKGEG